MKDLKDKTIDELHKLLAEKREALRNFRLGASTGKAKNVKEGREVRKDIARILTRVSSNISGK